MKICLVSENNIYCTLEVEFYYRKRKSCLVTWISD